MREKRKTLKMGDQELVRSKLLRDDSQESRRVLNNNNRNNPGAKKQLLTHLKARL